MARREESEERGLPLAEILVGIVILGLIAAILMSV
jgi:Tfp pilus assembly protein FimT